MKHLLALTAVWIAFALPAVTAPRTHTDVGLLCAHLRATGRVCL